MCSFCVLLFLQIRSRVVFSIVEEKWWGKCVTFVPMKRVLQLFYCVHKSVEQNSLRFCGVPSNQMGVKRSPRIFVAVAMLLLASESSKFDLKK